ncbi:glycosyltransferase family 9 protein [Neorhodopirellula lusitana]|uniref:glycosyltransferase family 9 protein n=1 Tax=Neorhodopirellula lusitana TaxID=445327 RepID=UPI00384D79B7
MVTSLLHTLRVQTDAELLLVVSPENRHALPLIQFGQKNVISPIKHPWQASEVLAAEEFDTLIDTHQWSRIAALLANRNRRVLTIGFDTPDQYRHFSHDIAVQHSPNQHELTNYQALLQPLKLGEPPLPPQLDVSEGETENSSGLAERPFAVMHPWAAGFQFALRQWPVQRWVELGHWLTNQGWRVLITGGPSDRQAAADLAAKCDRPDIQSVAGECSLTEVAWLLSKTETLISVNTGIMHLGSILGAPTVSLNGPTNPDRWGPVGENSVNVNPPSGRGGYLNLGFEYPRNPQDVMSEIEPSTVYEVIDKLRSGLTTPNPTFNLNNS